MTTTTATTESLPAPIGGRISKTAAYYAAFVALGLTAASLGPTLPGLAENTRSVLSEISFLFAARSLGYLLGSFLGGRFYDRLPGHPVMAVALFVMIGMMALVPIIPMLQLLTLILLGIGVAEGTLDVGGNTLLVWVHKSKVGPFMNGLHFFFGIGAFLSPIVIAQAVLMSGDIKWAYWALALLLLPAAIWLLRLSSPPIQSVSKSDPNARTNPILVALFAVFFFLHVGAEASYGGWVFTYAVSLELTTPTTAAYLTSAFWGALTVGRLMAIPIAVRFRPRTMVFADLLGCLVSAAIILLWPGSLTALWIGTLGMGFSIASLFPTSITLAEHRMTITGKVTGWFFVGASAGGMTLPWLIGQRFESIGPIVTMIIILAAILAAFGVFAGLLFYSARLTYEQK